MKERKRGGGGQEKRVEGQREGPPPAIGSIAAGRWGGGGRGVGRRASGALRRRLPDRLERATRELNQSKLFVQTIWTS